MEYDFSGWATRNNIRCSDGRTIRKDAFKDNDGQKVPLVWNHSHNDPSNVLGHALLENRDEGVYAYCTFNDTENGRNAKTLVQHGDIDKLSIYANRLKQNGGDVIHGSIREVSLVYANANPGAYIVDVMAHGDDVEEGGIIYTDEKFSLYHADDGKEEETKEDKSEDEETVKDVFNTLTEKQKNVVYFMIGSALEKNGGSKDDEAAHSDTDGEDEETVKDVFNTLTEKQKNVVYFMIGSALEKNGGSKDDEAAHSDTYGEYTDGYFEGGNEEMKHNVFDKEDAKEKDTLSHADQMTIISDAKRYGSMKESFLAHADEYGIQGIDWLFPEARTTTNVPEFIKRDTGWVSKIMGAVHKSPFSRIKSVFADITEDEARAKGYMKGKLKKDEVFSLLKRTTTPTTIYKKQKMDRDDVIDITDFDVIAWLKSEMRLMLDEEIARAILLGDGRPASSDDKINELNIRPIVSDEELYTIQKTVDVANSADADTKAKAFIRAAIKARKDYKGSGNPTLFTTEDLLTDMLLLTDEMGRDLYESEEKLRTKLRVKEIVTVEVMEGATGKNSKPLMGIIVNPADYNVGADKGGAINMFDDFDIDYNQQKYLIETRCSGALTKPYSAIALTLNQSA